MYERFDSFIGRVVCSTKKGCWAEAEDRSGVMGFFPSGGHIGDRVLCTVRHATDPYSLYLLLDSVLEFAPLDMNAEKAA